MPDGGGSKILFVEGGESCLSALAGELCSLFSIETARGAEQGTELIGQRGPFAVVVADLHIQENNGIDFLRQVRRQNPDSVCVVLTDHNDVSVVVDAVNEGIVFRFLTTPCPSDVLGKVLAECLTRHITEHEALAEALQKSEAGYQRMMANLPGVVYQFTLRIDGSIKFLFVSDACREMFGLEPDCIKEDSNALMNRFKAADRADFYQMIAESAATLEPCRWRGCGRFNDDERWFHGVCRPERLGDAEIVWDGVLTDITEYMRIEKEKEQLARFPGEDPNPVMRVNAAGVIIYANKAAGCLLNCWGRRVDESLPEDLLAMVGRLRGSGDHDCLEARCGDRVHSITVASVKGADYVNLYVSDITQAKDAEDQLIKANEILREHDRLKSEFVRTVSHELRTPLCIFKNITSNAMAGVMGKISNKLYESLKMAEQSIDRLSGIISDFLDISKIEADDLELNMESIDVQTVLAEIVDSLQALARAKGIEIKLASCAETPQVSADATRFVQILTNLIGNAIKFIPANGHITVAVKDCADEVRFTVADDGPGLSEQEVAKVFDRFVQIHLIAGPGEHGTGLGLTITRKLVEMHGGRIWVESALGEGCRFHFVLPKCRPSVEGGQSQPELVETEIPVVWP